MEKELVERAREFLKHEDGVLSDVYQIMAAFAAQIQSEREKAMAKTLEAVKISAHGVDHSWSDYDTRFNDGVDACILALATPPGA